MKRWVWLLVGTAVVVSACGSTHHVSTPPVGTPTTTSASTASSEPSSSTALGTVPSTVTAPGTTSATPPPNTGPVATTVPPPPGRCSTTQLAAQLGSAEGAAGTIYYQLVFRNTSGAACFVQGYAGVSFVAGADGHQVGAAATRVAGSAPNVMLSPQQEAIATLAIVDATNFGSPCGLTAVLGLRVYPPDETAALFVPDTNKACANTQDQTLRIGPFQAA
jgi:hypothetical protein